VRCDRLVCLDVFRSVSEHAAHVRTGAVFSGIRRTVYHGLEATACKVGPSRATPLDAAHVHTALLPALLSPYIRHLARPQLHWPITVTSSHTDRPLESLGHYQCTGFYPPVHDHDLARGSARTSSLWVRMHRTSARWELSAH
jgi:hypothetical protein